MKPTMPCKLLAALPLLSFLVSSTTGCCTYKAEVTIASPDPDVAGTTYEICVSGSGPKREGLLELSLKNWEKARDLLEKTATDSPEDHEAQFYAGLANEQLGETEKAHDYYYKAFKLSPQGRYKESYDRTGSSS
jgi:tetratricopeptide (TPR) repeat protein